MTLLIKFILTRREERKKDKKQQKNKKRQKRQKSEKEGRKGKMTATQLELPVKREVAVQIRQKMR